jgi:hypothetical protein
LIKINEFFFHSNFFYKQNRRKRSDWTGEKVFQYWAYQRWKSFLGNFTVWKRILILTIIFLTHCQKR